MTSRLVRADLVWIAATVLLAFALRLAWVLYAEADPTDGRFNDSVFYHVVAAHMADGGGYTNPFTFLPSAQWAPGYVFFLTGLYWLFGAHYQAAEVANAVLGAATVGVLYLLALELFDRPSARVAAVLLALFPGQILFASVIYSETLFNLVFVIALLLLVKAGQPERRGAWVWLAAFGLAAGTAALVRGVGLWLLIVAPAYWMLTHRDLWLSLRWTAVAVAAAGAIVLPWTVRNVITMDAPVLISTSAGVNFWQGHHAGAGGGNEFPQELLDEYGPLTRPGAEVAMSNAGFREGIRFALTHPSEELRLSFKKVRALYEDDLIALDLNEDYGERPFMPDRLASALRPATNAFYFFVLAAAALAMLRWAIQRGRAPLLPVIVIAVWTLGHMAIFGAPRYHFPLVPMFCILAGWALAALLRRPAVHGAVAAESPNASLP